MHVTAFATVHMAALKRGEREFATSSISVDSDSLPAGVQLSQRVLVM